MENKYIVKVANIFAHLIEVDAHTEDEARSKVKELLTDPNNNVNYPLNYEATLPEEHWGVIAKEEYDKLKEEAEQKNQSSNKL